MNNFKKTLALLLIAVMCLGVLSACKDKDKDKEDTNTVTSTTDNPTTTATVVEAEVNSKIEKIADATDSPSTTIIAKLNDSIFYLDEALLWQAVLEDQTGLQTFTDTDKAQIIEQIKYIICRKLYVEELAKKENLVITDEAKADADKEAEAYFLELPEVVKNMGVTLDTMKESYYKEWYFSQIYDKVLADFTISEEEMNELLNSDEAYVYYTTHDVEYLTQQAKVKQIYIAVNESATEEEKKAAEATAKEVEQKVIAGDNFAELVNEYSDDLESKEYGGELTFARGEMPEEFEAAAFEMKPGEIRNIKSDYGYHIIVLEEFPAITDEEYSEFKTSLEDYLAQMKTEATEYIEYYEFWDRVDEMAKDFEVILNKPVWEKISIGINWEQ